MSARPPGELSMVWLIARRAATEALRDRLTLAISLFIALVMPPSLILLTIRPRLSAPSEDGEATLGALLALYLLTVGLMPAISSVGIAAGQFAGEKERGVLTPLLASPASNIAIFGGKVLGAILPPMLYALIAEAVYMVGIALLLGPARLLLLPAWLSVGLIALVPVLSCFAAIVASLISSRVRTFNTAQQVSGLVLVPVWAVIVGGAFKLQEWGPAALFSALALFALVDLGLTVLAARTWRREEVLSHT